jgi:hypothetical protein
VKLLRAPLILTVLALALVAGGSATAATTPPAPAPLTPANAASVTLPFTISWSAVSDPSGILAYNWQVSATSTFAKVLRQDSVMAPTTNDAVSGLANGTYFWRVQAVSNDFVSGAWSAPRSFSVTGATAGVPGTPTLNQPRGGTSFHPWESFGMSWSATPRAVKYVLEGSKDAAFPASGVVFRWEQDTPFTDILITTVDRGNWNARVFAVDANGNYSQPSNTIKFTIAFNAPIAAPPTLVSPTGGASASLPITFKWNHVINPQSSGYHLQIARDSGFTQIEQDIPFLNGPEYTVVQLPTAGTKFWRVRSFQGVKDTAGTAAATAFSQVGTFVVPDGPLRVNAIDLARPAPFSGQDVYVNLQLNKGAPAGGATINLTSSNPQAAPLPASVRADPGVSFVAFIFWTGQVTAPTTVTMTATIGSESTTQTFTVSPSSLKSIEGMPLRQNGGVQSGGIIMLNGQAPPGGAVVSLSSSNPAARPPASVTVPAGVESVAFAMPTSQVSADTPVTITATWKGVSVQANTTLTPQPKPTSITLDPAVITGGSGSFGRVTAEDPRSEDVTFTLTSSRPDIVLVDGVVVVPQFAAAGGFNIDTRQVTTRTLVDISVSGGGVTLKATLTLDPISSAPPPPALSTFVLNPSNLQGGASSAGTAILNGPAPSGGTVVSLSSSNTAVASVPASVTVPAGADRASFTVATTAVTTTQSPVITVSAGGVTQTMTMTVNPPPPPPTRTLTALTLSPATVTGGSSSTGTVTLSGAAPAGGAVVNLSSADPTVATVPASVTVPAGASSSTFAVATSSVSASQSVFISGTAGGVTQSAQLTVNPSTPPPPPPPPPAPAVSALGLNPSTVTGGAGSTGTVTLSSAAPAGGLVVNLTSNNTAASVPASVTVAAGATTATFSVTTTSVTATQAPVISATGGGATRTATLTVNSAAATDTVTISRLEWGGGQLRVEATSSNSSAMLKAYVTSTGALIGTLSGGRLDISWPSNPVNVTVRSSLGGSASRAVTLK